MGIKIIERRDAVARRADACENTRAVLAWLKSAGWRLCDLVFAVVAVVVAAVAILVCGEDL